MYKRQTFSYANANYDLLGRIIEGATGETYTAYLDEHVLGPLGMASSTADADEAAALGMAPGHRDWFGLHLADGFRHAQGDSAWGGPASGYVAASVEDMASYLRMYLNDGATDGGARVLSPDSVRSMFLDRVPDPAGDTYYGCLLYTSSPKRRIRFRASSRGTPTIRPAPSHPSTRRRRRSSWR